MRLLFSLVFLIVASLPTHGQDDASIRRLSSEADSCFWHNNYLLAHEKYLNLLALAEKQENPSLITHASAGIARCHYYMNDRDSAIKWFYKYLDNVRKFGIDSLLADANYLLGAMYIEISEQDSVNKYTLEAIRLFSKDKKYAQLSRTYSTLAELHINTSRDRRLIETYLNEAWKYAEMSKDNGMLGFAASKFYNYNFYVRKDYQRALHYVSLSEDFFAKAKNRESLLNAYRAKAECLIMLHDTLALDYMYKWFMFKDSIFNLDKAEGMAHYEALYETKNKESRIREQEQMLRNERHSRRFYIALLSALLMLALSLMFLYRQRSRHRAQMMLQEQQELMVKEIYNAEQKERVRIARDLHDSIGQKLSVIRLLMPKTVNNPDLEKISTYLDETAAEVRNISHNLIPEVLGFGLVKAIDYLADRINGSGNIRVNFEADERISSLNLPKQTELSLYRIVQEILSNIVRHAQSGSIVINLGYQEPTLQISIVDSGIGFDSGSVEESGGLGWKNIYARIRLINGNLKIESERGKGSSFVINIPLS